VHECSRWVKRDSTVFDGMSGSPDRSREATIDILVSASTSMFVDNKRAARVRLESARARTKASFTPGVEIHDLDRV
jgi:hypothetical protein